MKIAKRIISTIVTIILVIIILFNILSFIDMKVNDTKVPSIFGYSFLHVASGSMIPGINVDDIIVIKRQTDYKKGDVITFEQNNTVITHRIIKINGNEVTTKGDSNNVADEPITKDDIYGKYLYKIDNGGKVVTILRDPIVIIMIVSISILIIVITGRKDEDDCSVAESNEVDNDFKDVVNDK